MGTAPASVIPTECATVRFYAVHLGESKTILAVVTAAYFESLKAGPVPPFYGSLCYFEFSSALSFTQLTALLPATLDADSGFRSVELERLTPSEMQWVNFHRKVLETYWRKGLNPAPPWVHLKVSPHSLNSQSQVLNLLANL